MELQLINGLFTEAYEFRALVAAILVGISCGILGCFIVLRNMALIGDALSHAILPGVVAGFIVAGYSVLAFFTGAVIAGFIAAVLITWLQQNVKTKEDSAIGIIFTVMFAIGIIGISIVNRQGVHLDMRDFLFGTLLGVSDQDLLLTFSITIFIIICMVVFYRYFFISTFQPVVARTMGISVNLLHYFLMLLLSFTIVASIQSVGVILVVAMLIIPASTAYLLTHNLRVMLVLSAFIGVLSTTSGLIAAILLNTSPGPAMTVAAAIYYGITILIAPEKGLIIQKYRRHKRKEKILLEDVLKSLALQYETNNKNIDPGLLGERLDLPERKIKKLLHKIHKSGWVMPAKGKNFQLSKKGKKTAYDLIRAHRLWETFLAEKMGLHEEQIHDQAEKYEHLLPEDFLDELDKDLGYPKTDPHGSPIPQKHHQNLVMKLADLEPLQRAIILTDQPSETITLQLWEQGITPNTPFQIAGKNDDGDIEILLNQETITISRKAAGEILIAVIGENKKMV